MQGIALLLILVAAAPAWAVDLTQQVSFSIPPQSLATAQAGGEACREKPISLLPPLD